MSGRFSSSSRINRDRRDASFARAVAESVTHYLPAFCEVNGMKRKAVCGSWTTVDRHRVKPTCPDCQRWLTADKATDQDTAASRYGLPEGSAPDESA